MLKNYYPSEWKKEIYYEICFYYDSSANSGFCFPCDKDGNLLKEKILNPCAIDNYNWCMENPDKFAIYNKVFKQVHNYKEHAHGTCKCGMEVHLYDQYMGACECPVCGQWYNLFGQELNPPETWRDGDDW